MTFKDIEMNEPTKKSSAVEPASAGMRTLAIAGVLLFLLGAALAIVLGPQLLITVLRWAGLAAIAVAGFGGRSLTYWIFFAMLLGGEIGLDRPQVAEHLRVLSDIFLRLIKVIVAPLIFGTLVTGIAGHGNLRSVGRIGLKSLIFFEVVTTLALLIGVGAIDISRAGEGLTMPVTSEIALAQQAQPMHWDDFLLHVFPENIAKSVAENQILQAFRNRAGAAAGGEARTDAEVLRVVERDDVFVHESGDVFCADRGWRGGGIYSGTHGHRRFVATGETAAYGICRANRVSSSCASSHRYFCAAATGAFSSCNSGAGDDCVCDELFGSGAAASDGGHGSVRRPAEDCGVRDSGGLQLQHGRLVGLFGAGVDICGAGGRHAYVVGTTVGDGVHANADEQRRGGSAARSTGGIIGYRFDVSSADRADYGDPGRRRADGHGAHGGERYWKLPGLRRDRAVGRRTSR
jgi:hypothetical protein